jgi:hypothetical protein
MERIKDKDGEVLVPSTKSWNFLTQLGKFHFFLCSLKIMGVIWL